MARFNYTEKDTSSSGFSEERERGACGTNHCKCTGRRPSRELAMKIVHMSNGMVEVIPAVFLLREVTPKGRKSVLTNG